MDSNALINAREFSYVSIYLKDPLEFEDYVVLEPSYPVAKRKAEEFAKREFGERYSKVNIYPRNYIKDARKLAAEGRIIT